MQRRRESRRAAPGNGGWIALNVLLALALAGAIVGLVFALRAGGGGGTPSDDIPLPLPTCAEASERLLIALTTNDGNGTQPNTQRVYQLADRLRAAGHRVVLLLPSLTGVEYVSSALDISSFRLIRKNDDEFVVEKSNSEPASDFSTMVHLPYVFSSQFQPEEDARLPDVVISGVNINYNAGPNAIYYGMLGGIVGSVLTRYAGSIPAIAVSMSQLVTIEQHQVQLDAGYDFVVSLLGALRCSAYAQSNGGRLLPPSIGLNVQLPEIMSPAPQGAKLTRHGANFIEAFMGVGGSFRYVWSNLRPREGFPDQFTSTVLFNQSQFQDDYIDSDSLLPLKLSVNNTGYIAITPIVARFDAPECDRTFVYESLVGTPGAAQPCPNGTVPDPIAAINGTSNIDNAAFVSSYIVEMWQSRIEQQQHTESASCCPCYG